MGVVYSIRCALVTSSLNYFNQLLLTCPHTPISSQINCHMMPCAIEPVDPLFIQILTCTSWYFGFICHNVLACQLASLKST
ncbi:hypothetical protein FGO68_gene10841 [Halteria grandinella]|uniref:Uncharacterized protein n=1 Tax=Halteria grandinella TaxID=5974 RepID=A0A8J8NDB9_HALGN|nr:hypothetical protein FGO68_gene10841 [Halteria grandinella]